jgi:hypothetical protein
MDIVDPCVPLHLVPLGSVAQILNGPNREYLDLPAIRTPLGHVITRWSPTADERARLLAGEDLYLTIWSFGSIQPVHLSVGVRDWSK